MTDFSDLLKPRTPVGEEPRVTPAGSKIDFSDLLPAGMETQPTVETTEDIVNRALTVQSQAPPTPVETADIYRSFDRPRGGAMNRAIDLFTGVQQATAERSLQAPGKIDWKQLASDEWAAMQQTTMGVPMVRYVGETAIRAGASFTQGFIDPIVGVISFLPAIRNTSYNARDPVTGEMITISLENAFEGLSLVKDLEQAGILTQDTIMARTASFAGDAAAFVIGAKGLNKINIAGEALWAVTKNRAAAELGRRAGEALGLSLYSTMQARGQRGIEGHGFSVSAQEYFSHHLPMGIFFPAVGAFNEVALNAFEKWTKRSISTGMRSKINNLLFSGIGTAQMYEQVKENGISTAEFKDLISSAAGTFGGFEMTGAYHTLFKGPARARTTRGLSHQMDLAQKYYFERALGTASIKPETPASRETLQAARRSQARAYVDIARTRISGEIPVTWNNLVEMFGVSKKEAKRIIAEQISHADRSEIIESKLVEGTIRQIWEKADALREIGLEPQHVVMQFLYDSKFPLDPVSRKQYEAMREGWQQIEGQTKKPPKDRAAARSEYERKLRLAIPKSEAVLERAKSDPEWESQIDGIVKEKARAQVAQQIEGVRQERKLGSEIETEARTRATVLEEQARGRAAIGLARNQPEVRRIQERAAYAERARQQSQEQVQPGELRYPQQQTGATPSELVGLMKKAQEGGLTGFGKLQARPEPRQPAGMGTETPPGRFAAARGRQQGLVGQLPGTRGPVELTGGVATTGELARRAGRSAPPPPETPLHPGQGPSPQMAARQELGEAYQARLREAAQAKVGREWKPLETLGVQAGPYGSQAEAVSFLKEAGKILGGTERLRVEQRPNGDWYIMQRRLEPLPGPPAERGSLELSLRGYYVSAERVQRPVPPPTEPLRTVPQVVLREGRWEFDRTGLEKYSKDRARYLEKNPGEITWHDVSLGLAEVGKLPSADFWRGGKAPQRPQRAADVIGRAQEMLGDRAFKGLIREEMLTRQPADPGGLLGKEWGQKRWAEKAAAKLKADPKNAGIDFYADSMMIDPATGKETGPYRVVAREPDAKNVWEIFNKEGLPAEMKDALSKGERAEMADAMREEAFFDRVTKFFKDYPEIGKMGLLAMAGTTAMVAQMQRNEDNDAAPGALLAGIPFFLFSKKKTGGRLITPLEQRMNENRLRAEREYSDAQLIRQTQREAQALAKNYNPRMAERMAEAVDGKMDPGIGGGWRMNVEQRVETLAGEVKMSWSQIRRAMIDGEYIRVIEEARPGEFEQMFAEMRATDTGIKPWKSIATTVFGLKRAGVGEALSAFGPGGQMLAVAANEATVNTRMTLGTIWASLATLPTHGSKRNLFRDLSIAEREFMYDLIERRIWPDRPRPADKLGALVDKLTPKNKEDAIAQAELMWQIVTGESGVFLKQSEFPADFQYITTVREALHNLTAMFFKDAKDARLLGKEELGFINPSGSYAPVMLRNEVFEPSPGAMLSSAAVAGLAGAVVGGLVDEDNFGRGAGIGAAAGALAGAGLGAGLYRARRAVSQQYQNAIEADLLSRGEQIVDIRKTDGSTRQIMPSEIWKTLENYKESRFQGMYAVPTNAHKAGKRPAKWLERTRVLNTLVGREWVPATVFGRYFEAAARRIEFARVFGPSYEKANLIFDAMQGPKVQSEGGIGVRRGGWAVENVDLARDLFDVLTGSSQWINEAKGSAILDNFSAVAVPAKLSLAGISQTGSWIREAAVVPTQQFRRNWVKTFQQAILEDPRIFTPTGAFIGSVVGALTAGLGDPEKTLEGAVKGGFLGGALGAANTMFWSKKIPLERRRQLIDKSMKLRIARSDAMLESEYALFFGNMGRPFLSRLGGVMMNYNGVLSYDRIGRMHATISGMDYFRHIRTQYESGLRAGESAREWQQKFEPLFRELFDDPLIATEGTLFRRGGRKPAAEMRDEYVQTALKPTLTEAEMQWLEGYAGAQVVKRASMRTEPIDMPASSQHATWKHMMVLNSFNFRSQAEQYNHFRRIFTLAKRGDAGAKVKAIKMLIALGAMAPGAYYGPGLVRRWLSGRDNDDSMADKFFTAWAYGGNFNVEYDWYNEMARGWYGNKYLSFVEKVANQLGVVPQNAWELGNSLDRSIRRGEGSEVDLWLLQQVPPPFRAFYLQDMITEKRAERSIQERARNP